MRTITIAVMTVFVVGLTLGSIWLGTINRYRTEIIRVGDFPTLVEIDR